MAELNEQRIATVRRFYEAFAKRDWQTMNSCYITGDALSFQDPAFGPLKGDRARSMWEMLATGAGEDFKLAFDPASVKVVEGEKNTLVAHWEAHYTFTQTGRPVHNIIDGKYTFRDGETLIATHVDTFSMWAWSRQALGLAGWLLGWTPIIEQKVQGTANGRLDKFIAKKAQKDTAAAATTSDASAAGAAQ